MDKHSIYVVLGMVAVSVLAGYILGRRNTQTVYVDKPYPVTVEKPVPVHDTVYETRNVYLPKVKTEHDTVWGTVTTSVYIHDTVQVQVPISTKEYEEEINDAKVNVKISGFEPNLESLTVINLRICPQTPQKSPQGRFSVGVGVGYGFGLKDASNGVFSLQPSVGVTFSYSLFSF